MTRYRGADGPLRFINEMMHLADGRSVGEAMRNDPWVERDVLRPIFERVKGLPRYRLVYIEEGRGSWKSGGAAAVCATEAVLYPSTDIVVCAADTDQASIVADNLKGYLARNPHLAATFVVRKDQFEVPSRGSRIRIISSDAPSAWGLGGTHKRFRIHCDELTVWPKDDLWVALSSATGKVPDTQIVIWTNAGFDPDPDRSWQWRVRQVAEHEDWGYLYSAPGIVASWITEEWQQQMRSLLPGPAYARVVENQWVTDQGDFVTRQQLRRCIDLDWEPQARGDARFRYFAGCDLGLSRDLTAMAVVHIDDDRNVRLDELLTWKGTRTDPVSIEEIERALIDAHQRYPGLRLLIDPWQMKGSIPRLAQAGLSAKEFNFSASSRSRLFQTLYSSITNATLRLFPGRALENEIVSLRVTPSAGGWRVDHTASGFDDRVTALSMALLQAVESMRQPDFVITGLEILHQVSPNKPESAGTAWFPG
jgi:phage terminase large subunit-like protein